MAHFEIRQRLGAGGMGAVFLAMDLELARDVALKILHPGPSRDPSLVARFRNEARACAQLNHDNIARVFYSGTQDGLYFIAYEFASGRTIRDLIQYRSENEKLIECVADKEVICTHGSFRLRAFRDQASKRQPQLIVELGIMDLNGTVETVA